MAKLQMVEESELMMPFWMINKYYDKWFPEYIIIRRGKD